MRDGCLRDHARLRISPHISLPLSISLSLYISLYLPTSGLRHHARLHDVDGLRAHASDDSGGHAHLLRARVRIRVRVRVTVTVRVRVMVTPTARLSSVVKVAGPSAPLCRSLRSFSAAKLVKVMTTKGTLRVTVGTQAV